MLLARVALFELVVMVKESSWSRLGNLLGHLGGLSGCLGARWGRSGARLEASWAVLERCWRRLGPSWSAGKPKRRERQNPSKANGESHISASGGCLGRRLGASDRRLGPSGGHLVSMLLCVSVLVASEKEKEEEEKDEEDEQAACGRGGCLDPSPDPFPLGLDGGGREVSERFFVA